MKKRTERRCIICNKMRATTNTETPFIGEPCLRTKGRSLLMFKMTQDKKERTAAIIATTVMFLLFVLGYLLGRL